MLPAIDFVAAQHFVGLTAKIIAGRLYIALPRALQAAQNAGDPAGSPGVWAGLFDFPPAQENLAHRFTPARITAVGQHLATRWVDHAMHNTFGHYEITRITAVFVNSLHHA